MSKIKSPSVSGIFYASDKEELLSQINSFKTEADNNYSYKSRAVIVPHAGLVYSGKIAYNGLKSLDKNLKTLFIIAPSHHVYFKDIVLSSFDKWETPLGTIDIDTNINQSLNTDFNFQYMNEAFEKEHSIEIQLPLIQNLFDNVKIVPVLTGDTELENIFKIINKYWERKDVGFIISSDLSHFHENSEALKLDSITANLIETNNYKNFNRDLACGRSGILGLLKFAESKNFAMIRIEMTNSSVVNNDKSRVVGYGCWFLYENSRNHFLKTYYSKTILDISKIAISSFFDKKDIALKDIPNVFFENCACFVTLTKKEHLRGCIGSIIAHRPFIEDLFGNARSAAFNDPRFKPLETDEQNDLQIAVSILSEPTEINFEGEQDLLSKITPFTDGLIIRDGNYQAVYLPSVWEQLPDKKQFLNSLKVKAGLNENHFSKSFKAFRFYCEYIKEAN